MLRFNDTSTLEGHFVSVDCEDIVTQVPVLEKGSATGLFYKGKVLSAVVDYYKRMCPCAGMCGLHILHDNAPAHRSISRGNQIFGTAQHKNFATSCIQP